MRNEWFAVVREELQDATTSMKVYASEREANMRAEIEGIEYPSLAPFIVVPLVLAAAEPASYEAGR